MAKKKQEPRELYFAGYTFDVDAQGNTSVRKPALPKKEAPQAHAGEKVPDPEFANYGDKVRVTSRVGKLHEVHDGTVVRTLKTGVKPPYGVAYEVILQGESDTRRVPAEAVEFVK